MPGAHRYGDGSGPAIALRLADQRLRAAPGPRSQPALLGRGLHATGTLIIAAGPHLRFPRTLLSATINGSDWSSAVTVRRAATRRAIWFARLAAVQPAGPARSATWRITTTSTAPSTISSSIATGSTRAPTSRKDADASDEAQLAKKRHIAAKLAIAPGQRVLDIGSGWGGLGALPRQDRRRAMSPA